MARAFVRLIDGDRHRSYKDLNYETTFGDERVHDHIEIVCDNGVTVTVYPDGSVGRRDWAERQGGMPRLGRKL